MGNPEWVWGWEAVTAIATVFAAVGTIAAVVVALWIAHGAKRMKFRSTASVIHLVDRDTGQLSRAFLMFNFANTGIPVALTGLSIRYKESRISRQPYAYFTAIPNFVAAPPLNTFIPTGGEASFAYSQEEDPNEQDFTNDGVIPGYDPPPTYPILDKNFTMASYNHIDGIAKEINGVPNRALALKTLEYTAWGPLGQTGWTKFPPQIMKYIKGHADNLEAAA